MYELSGDNLDGSTDCTTSILRHRDIGTDGDLSWTISDGTVARDGGTNE